MGRDTESPVGNREGKSDRFVTMVAILIAIASMASAGVVWRATIAESSATTSERAGVIEVVKREALLASDVTTLMWEADQAADYMLYLAQYNVLTGIDDSAAAKEAEGVAVMVDSLAGISPLATDESYQTADGGLDLDARLADIRAANVDLRDLDPSEYFAEADRYHLESRLLLTTVVVFAISLFFLTIAEITQRRARYVLALVGAGIFLIGVVGVIGCEFYCHLVLSPTV